MRSNTEILSQSWAVLQNNWLTAIGLTILHGVISGIIGSIGFGVGSIVLSGALTFGFYRTMVQIYRGQTPQFETYFDGFRNFLPTLIAFLLTAVIVIVGMILFIIPGVLAAISLSQTFYVLQDRPELGAEGAIRESARLVWTNGKMWKVFFMGFLCMFVLILGILAFGVGVFFAAPLISVMGAGLYDELLASDRQGASAEFI